MNLMWFKNYYLSLVILSVCMYCVVMIFFVGPYQLNKELEKQSVMNESYY